MSSAVTLGGMETKSISWRSIALSWWAAGRWLVTRYSPAWETHLCHVHPCGAGSCGNKAATPLSHPAMWGEHSEGMQPLQKHSWMEEHLPSRQNQTETCSLAFASPPRQWGAISAVPAETCSVQLSLAHCWAPSAATAKGRVCLSHLLKAPPVPFLTLLRAEEGKLSKELGLNEWKVVRHEPRLAGSWVSNTQGSAEVGPFVCRISTVPVRWNLGLLIQLIFLANCWPIAVYSGFFLSW